MPSHIRKFAWLGLASLVILSLIAGTVVAHEGRPVGDYRFIVGWKDEPAYEGSQNAVSVRVNKIMEVDSESGTPGEADHSPPGHSTEEEPEAMPTPSHEESEKGEQEDHHGGSSDSDGNGMEEKDGQSSLVPVPIAPAKPLASMAGQHEGATVPVEGLEQSLQVEVTYVPSGASRILDLQAAWGDPGHYLAGLIPTAAGVYEFRVFGTIEGMAVDETFVSRGGGGGFDDIQTSADIQFPVQLPELREIESGVRGATQTAQEAQDAALASQDGGSGNALAIVALVVGIVGAILGAGGIYFGLHARQSQETG